MPQGGMDAGAAMFRTNGQILAPCSICISTIHGGHMPQGGMDAGAAMFRSLSTSLSPVTLAHPCASDERTDTCSLRCSTGAHRHVQ